jgi:DNA-binding MarR family transcriptional regulator
MLTRYSRFTYIISEISKNLHKVSHGEMQRFGLHGSYAKYVLALYRSGAMTAAQLSEVCDRNKADVSRAIVVLENENVVKKLDTPTHYRVKIELTERGLELGCALSERLRLVLERVSGEIPKERLTEFYETLETISDNLERLSDEMQ